VPELDYTQPGLRSLRSSLSLQASAWDRRPSREEAGPLPVAAAASTAARAAVLAALRQSIGRVLAFALLGSEDSAEYWQGGGLQVLVSRLVRPGLTEFGSALGIERYLAPSAAEMHFLQDGCLACPA